VTAVVAYALGVAGFRTYLPGRQFTEYLYRSLQLFIIYVDPTGVPDPAKVPVALDVARFLAPAAGAAAGIRAVLGLFGQRAARAWVRYFVRDHVVVCGLGALGDRLAAAFSEAGHRVVGVDATASASALTVAGDATDRATLRKAGVPATRYLVVASDDDAWNAEVALAARDVVAHRRRGLPCFVHVAEPGLSGLLAEAALGAGGTGQLRLEFFNVWESVPPIVLDDFPPGDHLLVVGAGPLGQALVMHAARRAAAEGRRLGATIVGEGATEAARDLTARYPRLAEVCDLQTHDLDVERALLPGIATSAYVTGDDVLRSALAVARALPVVKTVVLTTERSGLATLVSAITPASSSIVLFDVLERSCRPEIVLNGTNELLARAVHAVYVRSQAGRTDAPALRDWEDLPEATKEANRAQAADIGTKLAAVGCRIQAWTDWTGDGLAFTAAEVETMARLEHERWCREHRADGWTAGPTRDDERKVSPYLVAWDELPESAKDYNRDAVRALPELLTFAGYEIVRLP
jgi:voltage-gated potassium channel Kch